MKNILSIVFLFTLLASSCNEDELVKNQSASINSLIFTASIEGNESRTYIEKGKLLRWTAGDQISLFVANTLNRQYQFEGKTGDNSGTFSLVDSPFGTGNYLVRHYAVYPYAKDITITDDTDETIHITATLPEEQSYAENSFGPGANTMVAVTQSKDDTFLNFKNVGGYLKLKLYGNDVTVKSITLKGNSNEKIAGKATITPVYGENPNVSMTGDATETITLNCREGVKIGTTAEEATVFWIVVPPVTFDEGFTVIVTDMNGGVFIQSTSKEIVIDRNVIHPMEAFKVETESIPNNQIWYTSSNGDVVTPYKIDVFGANIVSNTYENGKGIITFDSDVTVIGNNAFDVCHSLTSAILPNSVTVIGEDAFVDCSSLKNVIIPNSVTTLGAGAFYGCSSLTNITIPDGVTTIGASTFGNCRSLTSITIPSSVTEIDGFSFYGCISLTSVTIPSNVTKIGYGAFPFCKLTSIVVEQENPVYDSRENCNAIIETKTNTLIQGCPNTLIPNSVTTIRTNAFYGCNSLTNITIPDGVTEIGNNVFYGCSSLVKVDVKAMTPPLISSNTFNSNNNNAKFYVPAESLEDYQAAEFWKDLNLVSNSQ